MTISRQSPFSARIVVREPLTPIDSPKTIYHISLDTEDTHLPFSVGDSIGVYGENEPSLVNSWLSILHASGEETIVHRKQNTPLSLRSYLTKEANLTKLTSSFAAGILPFLPNNSHKNNLQTLLDPAHKLSWQFFCKEHEPMDLLMQFPNTTIPYQVICDTLSPLLPRFYSIASSPKISKNTIDLTVAHIRYESKNQSRFGVASHFLCSLANMGTTPIPIYIQKSIHFTLPNDPLTPIIMIGPGTGVAPFRGFMQERALQERKGPHWLFFGEKYEQTHFLYRDFWEDLKKNHSLKLTTAFSRDQPEKIYVQHRITEQAHDLWEWVKRGAYIYVCGDAEKMAKDVEESFLIIFQKEGLLSTEKAKELLMQLKHEKRYRLDVY